MENHAKYGEMIYASRKDELIVNMFDCMAKYLSWNLLFQKSYYATAKDELSKNQDAMKELEDIGKEL